MSDKFRFPDFDFARMLADMKLPGVDPEAVLEAQRKNIEALQTANRLAAENMAAIFERQAQMMREAMEQIAASARTATAQPGSEAASKQADFARTAMERAVGNLRELAEMSAKSNQEVFEVINARARQALEELQATLARHDRK
jgi:phasin family protein